MFNDKKIFSKYPLILGGPKWLNFKFKIRVEFKKLPKKKKTIKTIQNRNKFQVHIASETDPRGPKPP